MQERPVLAGWVAAKRRHCSSPPRALNPDHPDRASRSTPSWLFSLIFPTYCQLGYPPLLLFPVPGDRPLPPPPLPPCSLSLPAHLISARCAPAAPRGGGVPLLATLACLAVPSNRHCPLPPSFAEAPWAPRPGSRHRSPARSATHGQPLPSPLLPPATHLGATWLGKRRRCTSDQTLDAGRSWRQLALQRRCRPRRRRLRMTPWRGGRCRQAERPPRGLARRHRSR